MFLELKVWWSILDRHKPPLTWRFVVYYCSAVYKQIRLARAAEIEARRTYFDHVNTHGCP
jgi:hypothetical protein